jgi:Asp-tRNA(Asn)/Glu-tRNA(Gln) amidotransferase A subunit family amidase
MGKKWYDFFVSVEQPTESSSEEGGTSRSSESPNPPRSAAQTVAQIASAAAVDPKFTTPVSNPTSFEEIYRAAEIPDASHGYTILKVAEMLQSEHIRSLAPSVKRSSILLALEAAGVKLQEVLEDAVRRDRALDTYERVQEKAVQELEAAKAQENRQVQAELDRIVADHQARIQKNNDEVAKEKERFFGWRLKKQQEEQKISDAVSYFTTENPITTSGHPTEPPSASKPQGGDVPPRSAKAALAVEPPSTPKPQGAKH